MALEYNIHGNNVCAGESLNPYFLGRWPWRAQKEAIMAKIAVLILIFLEDGLGGKIKINEIKDVITAEITHFLNKRNETELTLDFKSGNRNYESAYLEEETLYVCGEETDPCDGITSEFSEKAIEMPIEDAAYMLKIIESKEVKKK